MPIGGASFHSDYPLGCLLQVNLMQYMKLSTSRDFRINVSTLENALQEQNAEDRENEPANDQVSSRRSKKMQSIFCQYKCKSVLPKCLL